MLGDVRRYAEDKVDSMRQQKDEELEQYKKEIERAKRFEATGNKEGKVMVVKRRQATTAVTTGGLIKKIANNRGAQ